MRITVYINDKEIEFNTKYTSDERGEIRVKYIFHQLLTKTYYMFSGCKSLKSIDLSSFKTTNVKNMSYMLSECSSLKLKNLTSFNTTNVTNMSCMFYECSSLKELNLNNFNTINVTDMSYMFSGCSEELTMKIGNQYNNIIDGAFED